ncbi:hypothetical protein AU374_05890 [Cupriavidus metallidurans]|nr:hypothetical protein AU374_05890 [Cupriavidus metallidurans]
MPKLTGFKNRSIAVTDYAGCFVTLDRCFA